MNRFATGLGVSLLVAWLGALAGCNGATDIAVDRVGQDGNKGFMVKTVQRGAWTRKYGLFVPLSYTGGGPGAAQKYPVIIFLHGVGEGAGMGAGNLKQMTVGLGPAVARKAEEFQFIVIFPQSSGGWDPDSEYVADMFAALDQVSKEYRVDNDRVILTGLSTGGAGTWEIGAKYHDRFAALVPMGSNGSKSSDAANLTDMPVRAYCSAAGDIFAGWNDQSMVNRIKKLNPNAPAQFIATPTMGHDCWENVYGGYELFTWMQQQRRGGATGVAQQGSLATTPATPARPVTAPVAPRPAAVPVSAPAKRPAEKPSVQQPRGGASMITPPEPRPAPAQATPSPRENGAWVNTSW